MEQKVPEKRQRISTLGQIGLQQFAPYLMNRIMGRYNATLREAFNREGRTVPQVRTLAVLSVSDGVTVGDLPQALVHAHALRVAAVGLRRRASRLAAGGLAAA